ncbi:MAG: DUF3488 and transglutaminase-like domain-containing protein [Geobacteraceae bacterium]|nr:DUF3488 and transglutaminase-like domain-containing protein [Geobacteraceae bacterium]
MVSSSRLASILCFLIALVGVIPIFAWLEAFPRMVLAAGLILGVLQEFKGRWYLKNWQFNLTLVPVFIWYALQYSNRNPIQPVVSVLVIMLAARLAGEKSTRNLMQINLLALFCLASRSLFELNPLFLVWLALLLLLVPVSLVVLTFHAQDQAMRFTRKEVNRVVLTALLITLLTVPAMALLFPILPRTALPLWTFLNPSVSGATGMSDKVEPGAVSNVTESRVPVFRAEMARQSTPPYWRGTVFNTLKAGRWTRTAAVPDETSVPAGRPVIQTIYPEPSASKILVGFDAPAEIRLPFVRMSPDLVFDYQRGLGRRVGYVVRSGSDGLLRSSKAINRHFYLGVPEETSPLIRQLAEGIKKAGATDQKRLELVEQHFLNGGYRYSRTGLPTGKDAIHQFLFVSKQGHCEFFASSCALLLRASGVPARLVGGYLGGEYNEVGGYYLVSQEMAHVWVEAYISGKGWVRTDPSRFATNAGAVWSVHKQRTMAERFRLLVDALDYRWNRNIVTYDFERQVSQLRSAGSRLQRLEQVIKARWQGLLIVFSCVMLLVLLFQLRLRWFRYSREERLLRRFRQILKTKYGAGLVTENKGLFELAAATNDEQVQQFVAIYAAAVYQDKSLGQDEIKQLRKLLDALSASNETDVISR